MVLLRCGIAGATRPGVGRPNCTKGPANGRELLGQRTVNAGADADGTEQRPWPTIQQAVDAADPAAIIAIAEGSYAGLYATNFTDGYAANLALTAYLQADFTASRVTNDPANKKP